MVTTAAPRVRPPAVAGYYYPRDPDALAAAMETLVPKAAAQIHATALIVPHGSLQQSGWIAGQSIARVRIPTRVIVLGASHTDTAMRWSLFAQGSYRTPLGDVDVDAELVGWLQEQCGLLEADAWGQRGEHAVETVLPFLQHSAQPGMTLVSILTSSQDTDECATVAEALELVVRAQHDDVLLLASTDLSHYHTVEAGSLVDRALLEQVQAVDGPGLLGVARAQHARMCGVGATATILMAAARLGARVGIPLAYGTSVPANGDRHSVIGYAGVAIVSEPV